MYFENSQASRLLPMPAGPMTETSRARRSRPVAWNRSLSRRSSSSRPTNGASSVSARLRPPSSATTRSARQAGTGLALPLSVCSPASSNAIALAAARWVASPTRTVPGGATDWSRDGGVDEVARDHALVRGADRDRGLAGQDAGPGLDRRPERADRVDELERGPDGALGVVLVGGRRAPHGHDRVADELLDRAAVAADDVARQVEVAGQQLAGVLGVAALGERREADEVGEQDRDEAALGDRACVRRGRPAARRSRRRGRQRLGALAAELLARLVEGAAGRARESERSGAFGAELASGRFSVPQFEQTNRVSRGT